MPMPQNHTTVTALGRREELSNKAEFHHLLCEWPLMEASYCVLIPSHRGDIHTLEHLHTIINKLLYHSLEGDGIFPNYKQCIKMN